MTNSIEVTQGFDIGPKQRILKQKISLPLFYIFPLVVIVALQKMHQWIQNCIEVSHGFDLGPKH